jgi:hypothetical protein
MLGEEHPRTITSASDLAGVLLDIGQLADAEVIYESVLQRRQAVLGDLHPKTVDARYYLATTLKKMGQLGSAHDVYWRVESERRQILGAAHPDTLAATARRLECRDALRGPK